MQIIFTWVYPGTSRRAPERAGRERGRAMVSDKRSTDNLIARLKAEGRRLTPQRKTIVEVFAESGRHLSAQDVYDIVKESHPGMGLTTVYRTLELLTRDKILRRVDFDSGPSRYELNDPGDHHHHLVCSGCGEVVEFHGCDLADLEAHLAEQCGFKVHGHWLEMFGLCAGCQRKTPAADRSASADEREEEQLAGPPETPLENRPDMSPKKGR